MNQTTRRIYISLWSILLWSSVPLLLNFSIAQNIEIPDDASVRSAVQRAHEEIQRRFINAQHGILYDYAGLDGTIVLPTPEEARQAMPNAMGWGGVPTEDGAFYNGMYLDGLCERWKQIRTPQAANEARTLAAGLVKLATISDTPGFIARNILADGATYYPAGSDDQTFPWFYGLWKYLQSGIPDSTECHAIERLIIDKAEALEKNDWQIVCDPVEFGFLGHWRRFRYPHLVRLPFVLRIVYALTNDRRWLAGYAQCLQEVPDGETQQRIDLLAQGITYGAPGENTHRFWLSASSQGALQELFHLEQNPAIKEAFRQGLIANATRAIPHIALYDQYDDTHELDFQADWRYMNTLWRPQKTIQDAVKLAREQLALADSMSPAKPYEFKYMVEPLFAAWVVVLSHDAGLIDNARASIRRALTHYTWSRLYCAPFFAAECIYYEGLKFGL